MSQEQIVLFGLGAVGSVYAYILNESGAEVTVCARSNYKIVSEKGLDIRSEKYGNKPNYKFHAAVPTPSDASLQHKKFSYVVCANKALDTSPTASEQIAPLVGPDTCIVLIQNGVGNEEEFQKAFPKNTVLSGVTWVNANQPETGVIVHKANETMQFGCHFNSQLDKAQEQAKLDRFVQLLLKGGTSVEVVDSINVWRWKKTIWNCCWNSLTALTLCNTAQYLGASPSGEVVARAIVAEMSSIARKEGHEIEEDYLESLITRDAVKIGIYSSMCMDAANSRPMEVQMIVAGPLRKAKELGLATPTLEVLCALLSAMNWRFKNGVKGP